MGNRALPWSRHLGKDINKILEHVVSVLSAVKHLESLGVGESRSSLTTDSARAPACQRTRKDWEVTHRQKESADVHKPFLEVRLAPWPGHFL